MKKQRAHTDFDAFFGEYLPFKSKIDAMLFKSFNCHISHFRPSIKINYFPYLEAIKKLTKFMDYSTDIDYDKK